MRLELRKPSLECLASFQAALEKGWGPNTLREAEDAREKLQMIAQDPEAFVAILDEPEARAGSVTLPDGSVVPRLPGFNRWMWDGEFCGNVNFRWQAGTSALPPHVLGHIGYSVVPWKRGKGYATQALGLLLREVRAYSLAYVELTTDPGNIPSQKVILANGGTLVERRLKPEAYGSGEQLLFRINL
jgi:predicted acetyltransferase